jgi:signal transduction histidine kinase/DNA-binding response OmpR family regulator
VRQREKVMENGARKINILLVDDNPANLLSLETVLEAPDRHLARASSGEEALRYLLDQDAAVILLDVHMPNIDGIETAALIRGRERTRNIPIIFLTAYDGSGDTAGASLISRGYSLGAVDYIVKPVDPEALKSKVAVFVELHRKTEQIKQQADLLRKKNIELENANLQRLSRLINLGQQLAGERNPELLLETLCAETRDMLGAHYTTIGIFEEDDETLRHFLTCGFDREAAMQAGLPQACQRLLRERFKNNRSLRVASSRGVLRTLSFMPGAPAITSFVGAPILQQGRTRGWLFLADKLGAPRFSEADEQFAVTLTQAFVFYENARLYAETQRHTAALEIEIAERKQAEKERALLLVRERAARAEAEDANRLKDEFLATVSHELRAPLNAMLGWVTLARKNQLDEENKARALETIERNARVQKKLIDDLLDVSRIITGKLNLDLKPIELVPVIEAVVESVRPMAEIRGVRLQTRFQPLPPSFQPFQGDFNRLTQVIWNLVHNAVKFTPSGGEARVCLKYVEERAEIIVSDTGQGIAPEFLPYVFDRFRQADGSTTKKFGGLGLGLSIVRHLVEMHGGTVEADSAGEGQGATFKIKLPFLPPALTSSKTGALIHPNQKSPNQKPNAADAGINLPGLRILVVDDQADVRELLTSVLRLHNAEVRSAGSVAEAMTILSQWQPEILISDIAMPDIDGYEFIRQVRSRELIFPAIALTAHASAEDRIRALAAGFQMHLPKPVEPHELVMSIASLTGRLL